MDLSSAWRPLPTRERWHALITPLRDYFRYHGPLAPGVRLLRRLDMRGKAAVLAAALGLPIAVLSVVVVTSQQASLVRAQEARLGLERLRGVLAIEDALMTARRDSALASAGLATPQAAADAAAVADRIAHFDAAGAAWLPARSRQELGAAWANASAAALASTERSTLELVFADSLASLRDLVVTGSGLVSSSRAEERLARTAALDAVPDLADQLAGLRGALVVLASPHADPTAGAFARQRLALVERDLARLADEPGALDTATLEKARRAAAQAAGVATAVPAAAAPLAMIAAADEALEALSRAQHARLDALDGDLRAEARWLEIGRGIVLAVVVLGCLLGVYVLVSLYRVMRGGLQQMRDQVARIASGDLSARPRPWGNDEIAQALASLGESLANLGDLFGLVRQGVGAVSHASSDIAGANQDLAQRTDESAQRLTQVLEGLERYHEQLAACGRSVDDAVGVIEEMRLDAVRSRSNMDRLQQRMRALKGKSGEIREIVGMIDGIAFRTSILALNASIEASKAGDAGRGFSVVAQEVRRLAERSAESARDIGEIIARSTEDIEQGDALAERAGDTLRATDRHVEHTRSAMKQIVDLTREGQLNTQAMLGQVRELDKLTGGNRTMVEQMARASAALSDEGRSLNERVASFRLA